MKNNSRPALSKPTIHKKQIKQMIQSKWLKIIESLTVRRLILRENEHRFGRFLFGECIFEGKKGVQVVQLNSPNSGNDEMISEINAEILKIETGEIQEIENAMDRLERGVYGQCESCGEAVTRARLKAIPEARFCIDCKKIVEIQTRRDHRLNFRNEMSGFIERDRFAREC